MKEELTYAPIEQTEEAWGKLREFFKGQPGFIPPTSLGIAAVSKNSEGEIVGALVCQMVPYLGPFRIQEEYQGHVDYIALKKIIDNVFSKGKTKSLIIQGYVAMVADERVAKLAEFAGMTRIHPIVLIETFVNNEGIPISGKV